MFDTLKPLFRFRGIDFRIHPSLWFGLLYFFWVFGGFRGESERAVYALIMAFALFFCVLLHEIGHAWAATSYGYQVLNLTLWLMGGFVQPAKQVHAFSHRLIFLIAGPAVNFILGVFGFVALEILPRAYGSDWGWDLLAAFGMLDSPLPNPENLLYSISYINLALAAFNLLPIFPLDGGQILQTLAQKFFGEQIANWILLVLGAVLLVVRHSVYDG
jgi:Zn-dependent protease